MKKYCYDFKRKKIKHVEYEIDNRGEGFYVLHYLYGVRGKEGAALEVTKEVYDYAMENSASLSELFELFDLHKSNVLYRIGKRVVNYGVSDKTYDEKGNERHHGLGYFVTNESNRYYLNYQLAQHGGRTGRFEISKEIFDYAKQGDVNTKDIFDKFNLSYLDVEGNHYKTSEL